MRLTILVLVAIVLAGCTSSGPAAPVDAGDDAGLSCADTVAHYCAGSDCPLDDTAPAATYCARGGGGGLWVDREACNGTTAVVVHGKDTWTAFYYDASGALVGIAHSVVSNVRCLAGPPVLTVCTPTGPGAGAAGSSSCLDAGADAD